MKKYHKLMGPHTASWYVELHKVYFSIEPDNRYAWDTLLTELNGVAVKNNMPALPCVKNAS